MSDRSERSAVPCACGRVDDVVQRHEAEVTEAWRSKGPLLGEHGLHQCESEPDAAKLLEEAMWHQVEEWERERAGKPFVRPTGYYVEQE